MTVSSEMEERTGEGERLEKDRQCRGGVILADAADNV